MTDSMVFIHIIPEAELTAIPNIPILHTQSSSIKFVR